MAELINKRNESLEVVEAFDQKQKNKNGKNNRLLEKNWRVSAR